MVANFIPWTEGQTIIRLEPQGYYHNMYNRQAVYSFARGLGLNVEEVLSALERDSRPNEVVVFRKFDIQLACEQNSCTTTDEYTRRGR